MLCARGVLRNGYLVKTPISAPSIVRWLEEVENLLPSSPAVKASSGSGGANPLVKLESECYAGNRFNGSIDNDQEPMRLAKGRRAEFEALGEAAVWRVRQHHAEVNVRFHGHPCEDLLCA